MCQVWAGSALQVFWPGEWGTLSCRNQGSLRCSGKCASSVLTAVLLILVNPFPEELQVLPGRCILVAADTGMQVAGRVFRPRVEHSNSHQHAKKVELVKTGCSMAEDIFSSTFLVDFHVDNLFTSLGTSLPSGNTLHTSSATTNFA